MLTYYAPLIIYLLSFPIIFITLFKIEIGILFFITLVPVIALMKKIVQFPAGNNFADFFLIALVIGWFIKARKADRSIFKRSPLNTAVILLSLVSIISLIRGYSFIEFTDETNLLRLMTWKNYMILPLIYFISINTIEEENFVQWIVICISFSMLAMDFNFHSTFRWLKSYHYEDAVRIAGPFSYLGPNEMGVFYSMYTFLLIGISYYLNNKILKIFVLSVCVCNFYPIIYSYSRAAYLCSLGGFVILGLLEDRRILLLTVALIILYKAILPNSVVERIEMTFLDEPTITNQQEESSAVKVGKGITLDTVGRKELWDRAMVYFMDSPAIGIGFDTFRHLEGMITHSLYLKILAEQGLIGLIIFIMLTLTILRQSYRLFKYSSTRLGQGVGLGFLSCSIVHLLGTISGDQSLYYNLMAIYWLFLGIVGSFNILYVDNNFTEKATRNQKLLKVHLPNERVKTG